MCSFVSKAEVERIIDKNSDKTEQNRINSQIDMKDPKESRKILTEHSNSLVGKKPDSSIAEKK